MKIRFGHEKLEVYQKALEFVSWTQELTDEIVKKYNVCDHINRAADSIVQNIAEGNGKFTSRDKCKYFDISRGSALESASCLDIMVVRKIISVDRIEFGKDLLVDIVNMLVGLIKSNSDRAYEPEIDYSKDTLDKNDYDYD